MRASESSAKAQEARLDSVLDALSALGGVGEEAAAYIRAHAVRLGFTRQRNSGARWFDWRTLRFGVFINADYVRGGAGLANLAALVIHEVEHLRQGVAEALSVRGELKAWQAQRGALDQMGVPASDGRWREVQSLNPQSRADLRRARGLIKAIAGPGYHIELLPLEPIAEELRSAFRRVGHRGVGRSQPEPLGETPGAENSPT